jgi:cytochrome d ubiquinol oxidase subunit II
VAFLVWTAAAQSFAVGRLVLAVLAGVAALAIPVMQRRGEGSAFVTSTVAILLLTVVLFAALYPNALPSTTRHAFDLTLASAASAQYTLVVMTVVAIIMVPVVLAYTAWAYWVFRHRLGRDDFEGPVTPVAFIEHTLGKAGELKGMP